VVDSQYGHRCIEGIVSEEEPFGESLHGWRCRSRSLPQHHWRRLECDDKSIGWLIRSGSCANVYNRPCAAKFSEDQAGEPGIFLSRLPVCSTDAVVRPRRAQFSTLETLGDQPLATA